MALSRAEAEFLLNQLFLPPKLPDKSDNDHAATKLLTLFATTAHNYGEELDPKTQLDWLPIAKSISKWRDVYQQGETCEKILEDTIKTMDNKSNVLVFLDAQNAAVLISRLESSYKFETWEVSAKQEVVLATKNSLLREFPALAIELPLSTVRRLNFVSNLAIQLSSLARESFVPESMEIVSKGDAMVEESRQSRNPRLVTEWLFTALASCGSLCKTEAIKKRIRDEVSFDKALLPWRRSPMWNCMRAALQLAIHNSPLAGSDHKYYKHFMLYFLSYIADRVFSSNHFFDYYHVLRTKIARRAAKLDADVGAKLSTNVPGFLSARYTATIKRISADMEAQWSLFKSSQDHHLPFVPVGRYNHDVKLLEITPYVRELLHQSLDNPTQPSHATRPQSSVAFSLNKDDLPKPGIFDFDLELKARKPLQRAREKRY